MLLHQPQTNHHHMILKSRHHHHHHHNDPLEQPLDFTMSKFKTKPGSGVGGGGGGGGAGGVAVTSHHHNLNNHHHPINNHQHHQLDLVVRNNNKDLKRQLDQTFYHHHHHHHHHSALPAITKMRKLTSTTTAKHSRTNSGSSEDDGIIDRQSIDSSLSTSEIFDVKEEELSSPENSPNDEDQKIDWHWPKPPFEQQQKSPTSPVQMLPILTAAAAAAATTTTTTTADSKQAIKQLDKPVALPLVSLHENNDQNHDLSGDEDQQSNTSDANIDDNREDEDDDNSIDSDKAGALNLVTEQARIPTPNIHQSNGTPFDGRFTNAMLQNISIFTMIQNARNNLPLAAAAAMLHSTQPMQMLQQQELLQSIHRSVLPTGNPHSLQLKQLNDSLRTYHDAERLQQQQQQHLQQQQQQQQQQLSNHQEQLSPPLQPSQQLNQQQHQETSPYQHLIGQQQQPPPDVNNISINSPRDLIPNQTTPPNSSHSLPTSLLTPSTSTPSTGSGGGLTPQHLQSQANNPNETTDLEDLEKFAKDFKQRRIKLGYTQGDVGIEMGKSFGNDFSQTTISRFEALNLSFKNMCKLKPLLEQWLNDADKSRANPGALNNPLTTPETIGRRRKKRTSIDTTVRLALEKSFMQNSKPTSEEISIIAEAVAMEKEVIRVWFCNRRQKEKRINPPSSAIGTSCTIGAIGNGASTLYTLANSLTSPISLVPSGFNPNHIPKQE